MDASLLGERLRLANGCVVPSRGTLVATVAQPCVCAHVRSAKRARRCGEPLGATLVVSKRKKSDTLQLKAYCNHADGHNEVVLPPDAFPPPVSASLATLHAAMLEHAASNRTVQTSDAQAAFAAGQAVLEAVEKALPPAPSYKAIERMRTGKALLVVQAAARRWALARRPPPA